MPENFGRYNLVEMFGEEGASAVYKAVDTENDHEVQIKIVQANRFSLESMQLMRQRFEREIKPIAKLTHPNILEIIDHGEIRGNPYMVSPWLDGSTLQQKIKERRQIQWYEALSWIIPITDALAYAHSEGIFHRDIKPANLFVTQNDVSMLENFHSSEILGNESTLDPFYLFLGTPAYMAPELGTTKTVDARSEIYALGTVFYEMITGRTPFSAETPLALMLKHVNEPLPEPRTFVSGLPKEVEKVIDKALAKNPAERYQSMNEFAMGLKKLEVLEVFTPTEPVVESAVATPPIPEPVTNVTVKQVDPKITKPEIVIPEVVIPEVVKPEVVKPEVIKAEVVEPEVVKPEIAKVVIPPELPHHAPVQIEHPALKVDSAPVQPNFPPVINSQPRVQYKQKSSKTPWVVAISFGVIIIVLLLITLFGGFDLKTTPVAASQAAANGAGNSAASVVTEVPVKTQAPIVSETPVSVAMLAAGESTPRDETLYFNGQQWGSIVCWNPYSSSCNNSMVLAQQDNARVTMFETPYMYNMLDGKDYPLLAEGPWSWNEDMTEITFKINPAAHWSDGTPVTAEDVAYTWASHNKYNTTLATIYSPYIDSINAVDDHTVVVKATLDYSGKVVNPLMVKTYISTIYVIQKAWTKTLEARTYGDSNAFSNDIAEDVVGSGPYMKYYNDDTKVILLRDDQYWGQDQSMWRTLPAPKYLAHVIYRDNAAGTAALIAGDVDVSQEYNDNVQDLWLKQGLPISTYIADAPYNIGASLPTAIYNLNSYGLDNVAIRKAIAMAVDYDSIDANAMTNQSATFAQVPRSLMNPTKGEQALFDHDAVKDLQWAGSDIAGAKALLDAAGITDTNGDGWREYNGTTLHYVASCPNGWSDWQAAIEEVAAAGSKIGIDITTNYPEFSDYYNVITNWQITSQGYDIFMMWTDGAGPSQPWARIDHLLGSEYAETSSNSVGNWGGYKNTRIDEILKEIPQTTDSARLKALYTEATQIYLTDVPSFTLMYRPQTFHTVNESIWTGFPKVDDGLNIPPLDMTDGYGIAGLYHIRLVNP